MVNLGIVVAEFNYDITRPMLERAEEHAKFLGANVKKVFSVPGVFDMPFAVQKLLEDKEIDAVVTLGAVIEGETSHDELISNAVAKKFVDLSIQFGKPVALGISGPGMTKAQAANRIDEYAKRSVEAAVKLAKLK